MEIKKEQLVAMAVCALAQEIEINPKKIRVVSFRECPKSSLQEFVESNDIAYKKYVLGDETT